MNTEQLMKYIEEKTGRKILRPNLSTYVNIGLLKATRTYKPGTEYFVNEYTEKSADELIRHLTAFTLTVATIKIREKTGVNISVVELAAICGNNQDKCLSHNGRFRIPCDSLKFFCDEAINARSDEEAKITIEQSGEIISELIRHNVTQDEIAKKIGRAKSLVSHIKHGRRRLSIDDYKTLTAFLDMKRRMDK